MKKQSQWTETETGVYTHQSEKAVVTTLGGPTAAQEAMAGLSFAWRAGTSRNLNRQPHGGLA
jgi:hypothetical protein